MGRQRVRSLRPGSSSLLVGLLATCLATAALLYARRRAPSSKFVIMTMSYSPRASLLEDFVQHYGKCPSLDSFLVVWNGNESSLDAATNVSFIRASSRVPVRFRIERSPSMNNRYKPDALLWSVDGLLSLDDDLRIDCSSIERAFRAWQRAPQNIVGWFPRFVTDDLRYLGEPLTIERGSWNMILSGAAFFDHKRYFPRYWSNDVAVLRQMVDKVWNCDDILFNFIVATSGGGSIYLRAASLKDLSSMTGVGISHDEDVFIRKAESCLQVFNDHFVEIIRGAQHPRKENSSAEPTINIFKATPFDFSVDKPPICDVSVSKLFCRY